MAPRSKKELSKQEVESSAKLSKKKDPGSSTYTSSARKAGKNGVLRTESKQSSDAKGSSRKRASEVEGSGPPERVSKRVKKTAATKEKTKRAATLREDAPLVGAKDGDADAGGLGFSSDEESHLLHGFVSSDEEAIEPGAGFEAGQPVPELPSDKGIAQKLHKVKEGQESEPGVVYIGRIPHGFHEHEMRAYFSQFGTINHVRLSRSRKTGNSKHYGFLEFASAEVAKIAADTMNNYLLFGHILKCNVVPKDRVPAKLWVGADRRFKKVPWARIEGRKLALPKGKAAWEKKIKNEARRRKERSEKLREIGYDYEPLQLKGLDTLTETKTLEAPAEEVKKSLVVAMGDDGKEITVSEEITVKKASRKAPKTKKKEGDGLADATKAALPEESVPNAKRNAPKMKKQDLAVKQPTKERPNPMTKGESTEAGKESGRKKKKKTQVSTLE